MESSKSSEDAGAAGQGAPGQRKDLSFLWPVIDRISAVEIKFNGDASAEAHGATAAGNVESRLAALESEVAALKALLQGGGVRLTTAQGTATAGEVAEPLLDYPARTWKETSAACVACVALLMLAHWLIIFRYDLKPIYLLLASILIPLSIATIVTARRRLVLRYEIGIAIGIALVAVFGMSYVTGRMQNESWLPKDLRDLWETLEYVASISLAYITGALASNWWQAHVGRGGRVGATTLAMAKKMAKVTGQALETGSKVGKQVRTIQDVINAAIPAGTAVASVITGIDAVLK